MKKVMTETQVLAKPAKQAMWLHVVCILLIAFSSFRIFSATGTVNTKGKLPPIEGYTATRLANEVTKLQSATALVYIKHVQGFYSTDHNPSLCWRGSGYCFQQIQVESVNSTDIYKAILQKGNEQLYTAWWYDNGQQATISQSSWRWDEVVSRKHYSIVNITAASQKELMEEVEKSLSAKTFKAIIEN